MKNTLFLLLLTATISAYPSSASATPEGDVKARLDTESLAKANAVASQHLQQLNAFVDKQAKAAELLSAKNLDIDACLLAIQEVIKCHQGQALAPVLLNACKAMQNMQDVLNRPNVIYPANDIIQAHLSWRVYEAACAVSPIHAAVGSVGMLRITQGK